MTTTTPLGEFCYNVFYAACRGKNLHSAAPLPTWKDKDQLTRRLWLEIAGAATETQITQLRELTRKTLTTWEKEDKAICRTERGACYQRKECVQDTIAEIRHTTGL